MKLTQLGKKATSTQEKARRACVWLAVLLILFSFLVSVISSDSHEVQASPTVVEVINRRGYVKTAAWFRAEPTTNSEKLKLFDASSPVDVYESVRGQLTSGSDLWYRIRDVRGDGEGYIHAPLVTLTDQSVQESGNSEPDPVTMSEFEAYLTAQGFPESYKPALRRLHQAHPTWVFQAFHAVVNNNSSEKLTFTKAVQDQYQAVKRSNGNYTSRSCVPGWAPLCEVAFETPLYNFRDNTWVFIDAGGWRPANREMVAHTMDPRTWLDEQHIFQFERLSYEPNVQNQTLVFNALKGTFMESDTETYQPPVPPPNPTDPSAPNSDDPSTPNSDDPSAPNLDVPSTPNSTEPTASDSTDPTTDNMDEPAPQNVPLPRGCVEYVDDQGETKIKTYAEIFMDAAEITGVNPFFLVQRCIMEVSPQGGGSVSGTVAGYEGYYNFYNIRAFSGSDPVLNGLKYARYGATSSGPLEVERTRYYLPWDSPWRAIVGGAAWIADEYIRHGQDTLYLQKFNLSGSISHQYMANLYAPKYESSRSFVSYLNQGMLETPFVFKIPVMADMPEEPSPYPSINGNRNNYLKSLNVSAGTLNPTFDMETHVYDVDVPAGTGTIQVTASGVPGTNSTIKNAGTHSLSVGSNDIVIEVISESNESRTYTLQVTRPQDPPPEIEPDVPVVPDVQLPEGVSLIDDYQITGRFLINAWPDDDRNIAGRIKEAFVLPADMRIELTQRNDEPVTDDTGLGTGAKIKLYKMGENEPLVFLELVIFGDGCGDGWINSNDYYAVFDFMYRGKQRTEAELMAMDAVPDGFINSNDYYAVFDHMYRGRIIPQTRSSSLGGS